MANKLISELDAKTTDASGNLLPLYQIGDNTTRKMTWAQFAAWQATYMIDNSLISAGGGDFFKNGSVAATAGFTFTYAAEDSGSQITNNASPTSSRLRLKGWDNLIGYTTNADDAVAGTYFTSDKAINFYKNRECKKGLYTNPSESICTRNEGTEPRVPARDSGTLARLFSLS